MGLQNARIHKKTYEHISKNIMPVLKKRVLKSMGLKNMK